MGIPFNDGSSRISIAAKKQSASQCMIFLDLGDDITSSSGDLKK
jgi:hypothetical protein